MNNNSSYKTHGMYLASGLCCEAHSRMMGKKERWAEVRSKAEVLWWEGDGHLPCLSCDFDSFSKMTSGTSEDGALSLCFFFHMASMFAKCG